ncbi:hypothetical protein R3P38DRAFT_2988326 [Favolaschia claudopus]|uniref:F-box domain-containing protein n=1 Tax=Favolaschia claudopus TaxID=2862362 RepID=A0AAW0AXG1_9AGAR
MDSASPFPFDYESSGRSSNVTGSSAGFPLFEMPRELIFLILDWLAESELLRLCEVSSESQQLALRTLLTRHGVSESQVQAQSLMKVRSRAIRSICASHPALISNIHRLDFDFTDGDVDHLHPWKSLVHLASRFPVIPTVTFTFSDRSSASERYTGLWNLLPSTLIALIGNHSRPIILINHLNVTAVYPKLPNILKRKLKTSKSFSVPAVPAVDRMKLTRKLLSCIATATARRVLSTIYLYSFPDPTAPLGALLTLNHLSIFYLNIDENIMSRQEWEFLMSELHLPNLRTLFVHIDFDLPTLSSFLEKHPKIEHLELSRDGGHLFDPTRPPFSASALPHLKRISASARLVARILHAPNDFRFLEHVGIGSRRELFADERPNVATYIRDALRALSSRTSVHTLALQIRSIELPWAEAKFDARKTRAEKDLQFLQKLEISAWTREAEHATFPTWLAMFTGLQDLAISGDLIQSTKGPLVSTWLVQAINISCPNVTVRQERCLPTSGTTK